MTGTGSLSASTGSQTRALRCVPSASGIQKWSRATVSRGNSRRMGSSLKKGMGVPFAGR